MLGAYLEVTKVFDPESVLEVLKKKFTGTKAKFIGINKKALEAGKKAVL